MTQDQMTQDGDTVTKWHVSQGRFSELTFSTNRRRAQCRTECLAIDRLVGLLENVKDDLDAFAVFGYQQAIVDPLLLSKGAQ